MVFNSIASGGIVTADNLNQLASNQGYVVSGMRVGQQVTADLTLHVEAGTGIIQEKEFNVTRTTKTLAAADGSNPRIDLIVVGSDSVVDTVQGTPAATPAAPDVPSGHLGLARILVPTSDTSISNDQIKDLRPSLGNLGARIEYLDSGSGSTTSTTDVELDTVTILSGSTATTDIYKFCVSAYKIIEVATGGIHVRYVRSGTTINASEMNLSNDVAGYMEVTLQKSPKTANDLQIGVLRGGDDNNYTGSQVTSAGADPFLDTHTLSLRGDTGGTGTATLSWHWAVWRLRAGV